MAKRIQFQEHELLTQEGLQWIRETDDALESGDTVLALTCLRKAVGAALLLMERYPGSRSGWHVIDFGWFIALQGDVALARDLVKLAENNLRGNPASGEVGMHGNAVRLEGDIAIYKAIREAISARPGYPQAALAKSLGVENSQLSELASSLCNAGEIVAANRKGRVYLWPAGDPGIPPASECRPVDTAHYRREIFGPVLRSGAEWERIRNEIVARIDEERNSDASITFLDFVAGGGSTDLAESGGLPILFDDEHNALGPGHLALDQFHAAAQGPYREHALRPINGWERNQARHTWMSLEMRDMAGEPLLREVHEGDPGAVPVTVITTTRRNTDPARVRHGRHIWLPGVQATNEHPETQQPEDEELRLGREAATSLIGSGISPDVSFPRWHERQWHTALRFGGPSNPGEGIPWRLENLEPIRDTYSEERVWAWILGSDLTDAVAEAAEAEAKGETWDPHPDLCLISEDGARLRRESSGIPGRAEGLTGKGGWKLTWVEMPARESVICGKHDKVTTSLSLLVAQRLQGRR